MRANIYNIFRFKGVIFTNQSQRCTVIALQTSLGLAMTNSAKDVISQALELKASERSMIAEALLASLDSPDHRIDETWSNEVDARIDAYNRGDIDAIAAEDVFARLQKS
ncbi:MAG: putative addiction module component (TIGR02574 family) [Paracoccaceae bacterium]